MLCTSPPEKELHRQPYFLHMCVWVGVGIMCMRICVCVSIEHKIASHALMCECTHTVVWWYIRRCRDTQKVERSTNLRRTSKTVMDLSRARIRSNTHARSRIGRPYIIIYIVNHTLTYTDIVSAHKRTHTNKYLIYIILCVSVHVHVCREPWEGG